MEFKHEKSLKNRLLDWKFNTWEEVHQFKREYDELEEVYIKAKAFDEIKKHYLVDLRSALNTTLEYSHPDAPCTEDMGSISFLLQQILEDLEDK
ncbi:hypothetical protein JRU67_09305 [Mammaliicoccus sciuri]|uniref:Uncharacterized protein n=1 Tax=Mammaliicoccus sciuri TaxID=1296 RepID=A0AB37HNV9_MAMSC|nr:hypothetical protein [Mammaliicoccus sciuri]QRN90259.1 hypothetical protein JRU67_09305 [Mammaliicoccus sciuri]